MTNRHRELCSRQCCGVALACLLAVACGPQEAGPSLPENALAAVDGRIVTVEQFQQSVARKGSRLARQGSSAQERERLLEELIRFEVLAANARRAGYDERPEVREAMERLMVQRFQQDELEARLQALAVGDAEVEAYYAAHLAEEFTIPEAVRTGVIFVRVPPGVSDEKRRELAAKAAEARSAAESGDADVFAAVATRYSDDQATRYRGGDAGWIAREDPNARWEAAVLEAAFELSEPGGLAPVIEGERGFYVVRLVERRPSRARPLAQVGPMIRSRLMRERRNSLETDFYAEMRRNVAVEINRELLESLALAALAEDPAGRRRPPRLPSGQGE